MNIKSVVPTFLLLIVVAAVAYTIGDKGLPKAASKQEQPVQASAKVQNQPAHQEELTQDPDMETSKQNIFANILKLDSSVSDIELEQTPVKGVYWVMLPGGETLLASADGRFVLGRTLSEFKGNKLETVPSKAAALAKLNTQKYVTQAFQSNTEQQIVYKAQGEKKGEIYVFTDVNCGYCRKFHKDVPELTQAGIEVHYLAGPFFSKDRLSLEQIWCAEDPLLAMDQVKGGQKLRNVQVTEACESTVSEHMALGTRLGIRGTPALYTKEGEQVGGYVPPAELVKRLTQG